MYLSCWITWTLNGRFKSHSAIYINCKWQEHCWSWSTRISYQLFVRRCRHGFQRTSLSVFRWAATRVRTCGLLISKLDIAVHVQETTGQFRTSWNGERNEKLQKWKKKKKKETFIHENRIESHWSKFMFITWVKYLLRRNVWKKFLLINSIILILIKIIEIL